MRDPKRIPIILEELEKIWLEHPDLRLGQLIVNLSYVKYKGKFNRENLIYYEEDEDFLKFLQEFEGVK